MSDFEEWDNFYKRGSVFDYLEYCKVRKNHAKKQESNNAVDNNGDSFKGNEYR